MIAHRGLARDAPENTLAAFGAALDAGATHLETDVHGSADGQAVVSHDPDLRRIAGRPDSVGVLTMTQLRAVPLGAGQTFCSLPELLSEFPDARINIDVKDHSAVLPTIEAIRGARATDRVLVGSFDAARRRAVVAALPGVATSLSARAVASAAAVARPGGARMLARLVRDVDAVQIPVRAGRFRLDRESFIRRLHEAGVEVHYWTIDDPAEVVRLLDAGADGIVTDRADAVAAIVRARAADPL